MMTILNVILATGSLADAGMSAFSAEPAAAAGNKLLSAILATVEKEGTVVSVDRDRRRWEVLVCQQRGACIELYLDLATGRKLKREREASFDSQPPPDAKPLSVIVASLERQNLGNIHEIDFDDREWEVEVRPEDSRRLELHVDPMTGTITRCRGGSGCPAV
ncbi:MAG: PepSY domain-containing protein [Pseudoxanthomonas sp.]|nr:PepSY domain-containing protein [Pseudoxanthomonas sp.]